MAILAAPAGIRQAGAAFNATFVTEVALEAGPLASRPRGREGHMQALLARRNFFGGGGCCCCLFASIED